MSRTSAPPTSGLAPFVGRTAELGALRRVIEAARAGQGSAVVIVGEAGIGKTRLVTEAAGLARRAGVGVLWASAWQPGGAPAYWHWIQILRSLAAAHDPQTLIRHLGRDAQELSRVVPDICLGTQRGGFGEPEGDDARFRTYDAVSAFLRRASEAEPLLVVLEDLHFSDAGSIALLRFVLADSGLGRLAVVGTTRDPAIDPVSADIAQPLAELWHSARTLPLRGLGHRDVAAILERLVGADDAARLASEIHRRSAGNPLFVGELAHLLAAARATGEVLPLPASIRAVIECRLSPLSAAAIELLRLAAVVGDEFSVSLLARAARSPRHHVLDALDHAARANIVHDRHPSRPVFVFAHALIREVLYEQLSLPARAVWHRRVGEALEEVSAADPPLAELAHHFLAGAGAVEDGKAAEYAERAGLRAAEQLAYEAAAAHFQAGLAALDFPGAHQERRIPLLLLLGDASLRANDLVSARQAFGHAAALARRDHRADLFTHAALGFASGLDGFEVRLFDHAQITLLEEALERLDQRPSALRAWAMARLSVALTFAAPQSRRGQLADDAVDMARNVQDAAALAYALAARCDAMAGPEHIGQRLDAATEIVQLARAAGDRGLELLGRRNRVIALLESGDIRAFDTEVDNYEMVAEAIGQPLYQWYVPLWRGMRALMDGRLEMSRHHACRAAAIGAKAHSHNAALNVEVLSWNTLLKEGRWRDAGDGLAHQLELADGIYAEPFWVALVAPRAYPVEARAALDRLAADGFNALPRDSVWLAAMTYAADACGAVGHVAVAERLYELILPYRSRFAIDAIGAACYGSMSRPLGVLAALLNRRSDAERHFGDALDAHRACGASALVAETMHDHGVALVSFGAKARASAVLHEARALYRSLGMGYRADLAEEAVTLAGGQAVPALVNVCRREGDYWTLAYQGHVVRMADAKGLRDIATLLAHPGRELHVADLISSTDPTADRSDLRARLLHAGALPEPILDRRARSEYRTRLLELRGDLEEAESNADLGRAEAVRLEMDVIAGELAAALGLGRRTRGQSDAGERGRKAVRQRIRNALKRITVVHPELAAHLQRSIHTGRFCSYSPERPTEWTL